MAGGGPCRRPCVRPYACVQLWALSLLLLSLAHSGRILEESPRRPLESGYPVADPTSCPGDEALLDFVRDNGGYARGFRIESYNNSDGRRDRRAVATAPQEHGESVVRVPPNITLSLETMAQRSPALRAVLHAPKEQCPTVLLPEKGLAVLFILHEALNATGFWRPFMCSLPSAIDIPLSWTDDELRAALESTKGGLGRFGSLTEEDKDDIVERVGTQKTLMRQHYDAMLQYTVGTNPDVFPPHLYTLEAWRWAWGVVQTRTWGPNEPPGWLRELVSDREMDMTVMVPLVDMFNHKRQMVEIDETEGIWTVFPGEDVLAGDEILVNYGPDFDDVDLFSTFGFTEG
mmetsp:Transcript_25711/g.64821  ORF Transcript_25711/g.64821 Transcript_25711/m.64821 type:complete len:345 (+) Transcript_25711:137-1171(+)